MLAGASTDGQATPRAMAPDKPSVYDTDTHDLSWYFCEADGCLGVRSSFGAMIEELARRTMSDDARVDHQAAIRAHRPLVDFGPLYDALGISNTKTEIPPWAAEYIRPHGRPSETLQEGAFPTEAAGRASHTRRRLTNVGSRWLGVLYAAYGPAARRWLVHGRGNPDHPVQTLGNGKPAPHLVEVAIAILECRAQSDPTAISGRHAAAEEKYWSRFKSSDLRTEATNLLTSALTAYTFTRHPRSCRYCWPLA